MNFISTKARSALGTSAPLDIQVCGAGGLGDIPSQPPAAPARGCLFPPAKANSSSDTVPVLQLVAMAHSGGDRRES